MPQMLKVSEEVVALRSESIRVLEQELFQGGRAQIASCNGDLCLRTLVRFSFQPLSPDPLSDVKAAVLQLDRVGLPLLQKFNQMLRITN
jgi:hypothetical protein